MKILEEDIKAYEYEVVCALPQFVKREMQDILYYFHKMISLVSLDPKFSGPSTDNFLSEAQIKCRRLAQIISMSDRLDRIEETNRIIKKGLTDE